MELAKPIIFNDKTVRKNTVKNLKDCNSQSLITQAKKRVQLVSKMLVFEKDFDLMGNDIVDLSTENEPLKNKIGSYDKKWIEESKAKLLKQVDDEKKTNLFRPRMERPMKTH